MRVGLGRRVLGSGIESLPVVHEALGSIHSTTHAHTRTKTITSTFKGMYTLYLFFISVCFIKIFVF
jgi:hypothetical protein